MPTHDRSRRRIPRALTPLLATLVMAAACTAPGPSATGPGGPSTAPGATPSPVAELTPVPGGATGTPQDPDRPPTTTTVTDWGTILDAVPEGFPVYPDAGEAPDAVNEPVSGAWLAGADVDAVAAWYVSAFEELGWSRIELGAALEDGARILDLASDLPECRVRATFRPADGSTIIVVHYGAGCAGGEG